MNFLDQLSMKLLASFLIDPRGESAWSELEAMNKVLTQIRERHDGP